MSTPPTMTKTTTSATTISARDLLTRLLLDCSSGRESAVRQEDGGPHIEALATISKERSLAPARGHACTAKAAAKCRPVGVSQTRRAARAGRTVVSSQWTA